MCNLNSVKPNSLPFAQNLNYMTACYLDESCHQEKVRQHHDIEITRLGVYVVTYLSILMAPKATPEKYLRTRKVCTKPQNVSVGSHRGFLYCHLKPRGFVRMHPALGTVSIAEILLRINITHRVVQGPGKLLSECVQNLEVHR